MKAMSRGMHEAPKDGTVIMGIWRDVELWMGEEPIRWSTDRTASNGMKLRDGWISVKENCAVETPDAWRYMEDEGHE